MEQQKHITKRVPFTRWRLLWVLIVAAWLFVILKLLIGGLFEKNTSLVAAFAVTDPEEISATVEVTACYPELVLEAEEKMELLEELAASIGLELDGKESAELTTTEQRQELCVWKEARAADTELRAISLFGSEAAGTESKHYVYARISLTESLETVLAYKQLIEQTMERLSCTEISTTIQLVGDYEGYLTMERRNEVTEKILRALEAEVVYEYREKDLYTVYAYTASLENYISVEDKKINLHIAMSQDEENYRTILYLASPVLPDTW